MDYTPDAPATAQPDDLPADEDSTSARLHHLLSEAGAKLAANQRTGYTPGFERTLADELLAELLDHQSPDYAAAVLDAALVDLVVDHLEGLIAVDCLLDECDQASYDTTRRMAGLLLAEIRRQHNQHDAAHQLVMDRIVLEAQLAETRAGVAS